MSQSVRSLKVVSFPESSTAEAHVAAVLVTKAEDGTLRTYVKDIPGRNAPDPEAVAVLAQAVELANL